MYLIDGIKVINSVYKSGLSIMLGNRAIPRFLKIRFKYLIWSLLNNRDSKNNHTILT